MSAHDNDIAANLADFKEQIKKLTLENEFLKQQVSNLNQQHKQSFLVFDNLPEAVVFLDIKGNIKKINQRVLDWLGYPPHEILDKNILTLSFLSVKSKAIALKKLTDRIRGKQIAPYDLEFITVSGEIIIGRIHGRILKNEKGNIIGDLLLISDATLQLKYENEIKESREKFKTLTDTSESAIFILHETRFKYINKSGQKIFGYTLDELQKKHFWDIVHPDDRALVKERGLARQKKDDIPSSYEFRIITKDNEIKWMHYTAGFLEYEGKPALIGNAFDVTKKKIAEEALRESFVKFQTIFNSSAVGIALTDLKGNILEVNNSVCSMLGYSGAEMKKLNFVKLAHPVDAENDVELYKQLLLGEISNYQKEKRYTKKNGTMCWANITVSLIKGKDGNPEYAVGMIEDITEKKQIQQQLAREQFLFTTLMKQLPDSIYFKDEKSRFMAVNDATAKKMGVENSSQLIGKSDFDFFTADHAEKALHDEMEMMNKNKSIIGAEEKETWTDGSVTWVSTTKIPLHNENNETIGTFGISRDITAKKEIEQKLNNYTEELKQLNANKDKFFSILAHDLRSPFTALLGYSDFICNDYASLSEEEIKEFAGNINTVAKNVYGLLENLLDWSRIQTGKIPYKPEVFNFYSVAKNVFTLFNESAQKKNIMLKIEGDESIQAFGDDNMVHTVLRNLISNAIKFTKVGGVIKILIEPHDDKMVRISVIDNGVGILEKDMNKLFDLSISFSTTGTSKEAGTGLGLILCKELVEKNGGNIWVESKQGEGSSFIFTLPVENNSS
ncbi:MAG: PAS domain S-box protein [Ignavibacteriaceae bacterium]|nr:PAS domain S-box protein [Ignavibacteriaceae bacterium]